MGDYYHNKHPRFYIMLYLGKLYVYQTLVVQWFVGQVSIYTVCMCVSSTFTCIIIHGWMVIIKFANLVYMTNSY